MKYNAEKKCITNDDGSLIKRMTGCTGHESMDGGNKYKCSSLVCLSGAKFISYLTKELQATGGLEGLYQFNGQWRSEHLDATKVA